MSHLESIHHSRCRSIEALVKGQRIEYGFFGSRFPVGVLQDPNLWGLTFKSFSYINESPYLIADREFELVEETTRILRDNRICVLGTDVIVRDQSVDLFFLVAPMSSPCWVYEIQRNPKVD